MLYVLISFYKSLLQSLVLSARTCRHASTFLAPFFPPQKTYPLILAFIIMGRSQRSFNSQTFVFCAFSSVHFSSCHNAFMFTISSDRITNFHFYSFFSFWVLVGRLLIAGAFSPFSQSADPAEESGSEHFGPHPVKGKSIKSLHLTFFKLPSAVSEYSYKSQTGQNVVGVKHPSFLLKEKQAAGVPVIVSYVINIFIALFKMCCSDPEHCQDSV